MLGLLLGACSLAYQPRGFAQGGYSQTRLAEDRFAVWFHPSALGRLHPIEDYLWLRGAQLCLQNDFSHLYALPTRLRRRVLDVDGGTSLLDTGYREFRCVVPPLPSARDARDAEVVQRRLQAKYAS